MRKIKFFTLFIIIIFTISTSKAGVIKKQKDFRVLIGGDVMFDWGLRETMKSRGFYAPVEGLRFLFDEVDLRLVNLETPVSNTNEDIDQSKSYVFNAKPEELSLLKKINIDAVFLANNHSMDYGKLGLEETFKNLSSKSIRFVGAGQNLKASYEPIEFSFKKTNLKVFSATAIGEQRLYATNTSPGAAPFNLNKLKSIAKINNNNNTINLLSLHWGIEYRPEPTSVQVRQAHALIDSGFKIIVGHHPHIPQGVEKYKDGVIFYSLGNFMFGSRNQYLNHNLAVILHIENNKLIKCEIIPIFGKFQKSEHLIKPLPGKEGNEFLQEIAYLSKKLGTEISIRNGRAYIYFD
ncbi:MAG: CapA family protein [Leptospiraceae bacterium]|nr:CapA family protein [Leptospiraceae bacterium]